MARTARPSTPSTPANPVTSSADSSHCASHIPAPITAQIAALPGMAMADLWALWDGHFPRRPSHCNRAYVESRLAYRIQELAYGALPAKVRCLLVQTGAQHSRIKTRQRLGGGAGSGVGVGAGTGRGTPTLLMPGTTLLREWDGRDYRVTVTPDGCFALDGHVFKSLSAAARHITGTQWNGPKFFGLRDSKAGAR